MQRNLVEYTDQDYYHSAVIRPPKDFQYFEADTRHTRIVVDSRVRDKSLFPNPNNYEITFEDDINDVREARLVSMEIPMPSYLVNSYFNKIYFTVGAAEYVATVATGDYSASAFSTALQAALDAMLPATFDVAYDSRLDSYEIRSTVAFSVTFGKSVPDPANPALTVWVEHENHLAMLMGFSSQKNYDSEADPSVPAYPNLLRSEFRRNFEYNNYLIMDIDQFDVLKSIDRDLNKSFAIIPKEYSKLNVADEANIVKTFSPPIGRLAKLRIKFYDRFGNPYDFQNMDHRFELVVTSFKQRRKYNV